eukprot:RCo008606
MTNVLPPRPSAKEPRVAWNMDSKPCPSLGYKPEKDSHLVDFFRGRIFRQAQWFQRKAQVQERKERLGSHLPNQRQKAPVEGEWLQVCRQEEGAPVGVKEIIHGGSPECKARPPGPTVSEMKAAFSPPVVPPRRRRRSSVVPSPPPEEPAPPAFPSSQWQSEYRAESAAVIERRRPAQQMTVEPAAAPASATPPAGPVGAEGKPKATLQMYFPRPSGFTRTAFQAY